MSVYQKRSRTLYRNLLDKEVVTGRELLEKDVRELDLRVLSNKVDTCIKILVNGLTNLIEQMKEYHTRSQMNGNS